MRPRSIGTWSKLAPGMAAHDLVEAGELVGLDVDEEKGRRLAGRRCRSRARDCPRPARPRPARVRPMPSESTTCAVGAPAGADWRAPAATAGGAAGASRRAPATISRSGQPEQHEGGDRAADKPQRDLAVRRAGDHEGTRAPAPATAVAPSAGGGTRRRARSTGSRNSAAGRHPADPGERPQREDERRQQAEQRGKRQRAGVDAEPQGHRQQPAQQAARQRPAPTRRAGVRRRCRRARAP